MADTATAPLPNPPEHNSHNKPPRPNRRVSFSAFPPKHSESNKRKRTCCSWCCRCCGWTCIVLLCILLFIIIAGVTFATYFDTRLPEFTIQKLIVRTFDVVTTAQKSYMYADIDLTIEIWNKNKQIGLSYGRIYIDVSSGDVNLGHTSIHGFSQGLRNVTVFTVDTAVPKSLVDNQEGSRLEAEFKRKEMVLEVSMISTLQFVVGKTFKTYGIPITIACEKIRLSRIAAGEESGCRIKMFSIGDFL